MKRIVGYLKRTRDKALILNVGKSCVNDSFVDADVAGEYCKEELTNPRDWAYA